jgi:hypothetical protein
VHPAARKVIEDNFTDEEQSIVRVFENEWYITRAGLLNLGISNINIY